MDHNLEHAKNLKLLLCVFEHLLGLKIKFRKSELFCYGDESVMNNTPNYLVVVWGNFLSSISEF
jgi:hypothetical protein